MRLFGIILVVVLNLALVMSTSVRMNTQVQFSLSHELVNYLALILLDLSIVLPLVIDIQKAVHEEFAA